jgi:catechol 2,3-dioxygenase-like lactoylglutathione lyase family enzyme
METRVSVVTLGVADMARARGFYKRLGWRAHGSSNADVTFFDAGGLVVALFGNAALAADSGVAEGPAPAFRGVTLALNLRSPAEVDATMRAAAKINTSCGSSSRRVMGSTSCGPTIPTTPTCPPPTR